MSLSLFPHRRARVLLHSLLTHQTLLSNAASINRCAARFSTPSSVSLHPLTSTRGAVSHIPPSQHAQPVLHCHERRTSEPHTRHLTTPLAASSSQHPSTRLRGRRCQRGGFLSKRDSLPSTAAPHFFTVRISVECPAGSLSVSTDSSAHISQTHPEQFDELYPTTHFATYKGEHLSLSGRVLFCPKTTKHTIVCVQNMHQRAITGTVYHILSNDVMLLCAKFEPSHSSLSL